MSPANASPPPKSNIIKTHKEPLLFALISLIFITSSILSGGRNYNALIIIEFSGALLLLLTLWDPLPIIRVIKKTILLFLFIIVLIPILYLIPIHDHLWNLSPNRQIYLDIQQFINSLDNFPNNYHSLSLVPYRTVSFLLSLTPILGIFIATSLLSKQYLDRLLYLFLTIAAFQATIGILQYTFTWIYHPSYPGLTMQSAHGMYVNYNHFAGIMELAIPVAIALGFCHFYNNSRKAILFFALTLLFFLATIFSSSRTGIILIIIGTAITLTILYSKPSRALFLYLLSALFTCALLFGLLFPALARRFMLNPTEDARWIIFKQSWIGVKNLFPIGAGPGTFQPVFKSFQPLEIQKFVNHIHNDYLELIFEMGIFGAFLIIFALGLYIQGWLALRKIPTGCFRFIKTGAGISLLLLMLHSMLDFQFHVPANAIIFTFLAGIFLHSSHNKRGTAASNFCV